MNYLAVDDGDRVSQHEDRETGMCRTFIRKRPNEVSGSFHNPRATAGWSNCRRFLDGSPNKALGWGEASHKRGIQFRRCIHRSVSRNRFNSATGIRMCRKARLGLMSPRLIRRRIDISETSMYAAARFSWSAAGRIDFLSFLFWPMLRSRAPPPAPLGLCAFNAQLHLG